jgi:putative peptidoglycan lipid II flippase
MQVSFLINQFFASYLPHGDMTCLYYGNRLMQLPYGVFGVSIATVVFPLVSRHAARKDTSAIQDTLHRALEAAAFITVPCIVGLALTAEPITVLAFQRGRWDESTTLLVTQATRLYVLGLFFFSCNKILAPSYYALQRPRWPLFSAIVAMLSDFSLNLAAFFFIDDMRVRFMVLPLATLLSGTVNFTLLFTGLLRHGLRFDVREILRELGKILAATALMGLAVFFTLRGLAPWDWPGMKVWNVVVPVAVGVGIYFAIAKALGCKGRDWIRNKGRS